MQAITDPGSFRIENVLAMDPGQMADVITSANKVRRWITPGFLAGWRPGPVHFWNPQMALAGQGSYQRAVEDLSGTDDAVEARNATDYLQGPDDDEPELVVD